MLLVTLTDFLEQLLYVYSIPGTGLHKYGCNRLCKLFRLLSWNFPKKQKRKEKNLWMWVNNQLNNFLDQPRPGIKQTSQGFLKIHTTSCKARLIILTQRPTVGKIIQGKWLSMIKKCPTGNCLITSQSQQIYNWRCSLFV